MTKQQAAAQGLPPSYADNPTGNTQQSQQQSGDFLQNLLGGLKGWGAGAIQDIAAPTYLAGQEMMHGQSPIAGVGNNANINQLNEYAKSNPFATKQQLQQEGGTLPQAATQVAKDTAGAASWMMPMSAGGMLARGALGAGQGALNGISQDGANPTSVATNAATSAGLNMINPIIAKGLQSMYGRMVFGEGGSKFGDIIRTVNNASENQPTNKFQALINYLHPGQFGNSLVGSPQTISKNIYNFTEPIRTQFNDMMANVKGGIPKTDIFGSITPSLQRDPENPGMIGNIINKMGYSAQDDAEKYAKVLSNKLDELHSQWLQGQGYTGQQIMNKMGESAPYPVVQQFLSGLGKDKKVWNNASVGPLAQSLYAQLRGKIAQATGDTNAYNTLQGLKQAGTEIEENLNNNSTGSKIQQKLQSMAERHGIGTIIGTGGATAALMGHPEALLPGAIAFAGSFPQVASRAISFANSPLGKLLGVASRKTVANTVGNMQTTQ